LLRRFLEFLIYYPQTARQCFAGHTQASEHLLEGIESFDLRLCSDFLAFLQGDSIDSLNPLHHPLLLLADRAFTILDVIALPDWRNIVADQASC